jgi:hypothetical protein
MEELGLAMLGGQLKYVSICILHTDFERMAYQLLRPAAVRLDQKSNQFSWRTNTLLEEHAVHRDSYAACPSPAQLRAHSVSL